MVGEGEREGGGVISTIDGKLYYFDKTNWVPLLIPKSLCANYGNIINNTKFKVLQKKGH